MAKEILAARLASLHNLTFFCDLMAEARRQIEAGNYAAWSSKWLEERRLRARENGGT
jgi:queuine tRNA-ribosyltransferase